MLNISQATSMLKSLGVTSSMASSAVERAASHSGSDPVAFLQELQKTLKELTTTAAQPTTSASAAAATGSQASTVSLGSDASKAEAAAAATPPTTTKPPFSNFEEFGKWEKGLGNTFAEDYETPDYIRMMGMSHGGGDGEAFNRYIFFKNHPQYAADYESIRSGKLSKFATDSSTLVKSDLSKMSAENAEFFRKNPAQLLMAEGFNMDPSLFKMVREGKLDIPAGASATEWLTQNKWTATGPVATNNRVTNAQAPYVGLDGKGADNYRLARFDPATGFLIDVDGTTYDPATGQATA